MLAAPAPDGYRAAANQEQDELNNTLGLATCKPPEKTTVGDISNFHKFVRGFMKLLVEF